MSDIIKPFRGQNFNEIKLTHGPNKLFEDPIFPADNTSLCLNRDPPEGIVWMRPIEVHPNAKFCDETGCRYDLDYGALGNCWFVAACLGINQNKNLFARVVPEQSFSQNYTGAFHFRFWSYGDWYDVVIDDRLPFWTNGNLVYTANRTLENEYWGPLLEKAYAKFLGCYENLNNGQIIDALLDMSGGIQERFYISKDKKINYDFAFWRLLENSFYKKSIVGCSIFSDPRIRESRMSNGSVKGHAFTITGIYDLKKNNLDVKLIKIQNPWGDEKDWSGAWSEGSKDWKHLTEEEKREVGYYNRKEGEFWMCFPDFMTYWDQVQICHLSDFNDSPASISRSLDLGWDCKAYHSEWKTGLTAGGSGTKLQTKFWTNPQFLFTIPDIDPLYRSDNKTDVIIALMQKSPALRRIIIPSNHDTCEECIQFKLYKIKEDIKLDESKTTGLKLNGLYLDKIGSSGSYINSREVQGRFRVVPGRYLIIPSTYEENRDCEFLLRVFTEKFLNKKNQTYVEQNLVTVPTITKQTEEEIKEQHVVETKQKEIVVNTEIKITEIVKQEISKPDKEMIESINQQRKEQESKNAELITKSMHEIKTPEYITNTEAIINEIKNTITNKDLLAGSTSSLVSIRTTSESSKPILLNAEMSTQTTETKPTITTTEIQTASSLINNLEISTQTIENKPEIKNSEIQTTVLDSSHIHTQTTETKPEIKNTDAQTTDLIINSETSTQTIEKKPEIKNSEIQTSVVNSEISTQTLESKPENKNSGVQVVAENNEISTQTDKKTEEPTPAPITPPQPTEVASAISSPSVVTVDPVSVQSQSQLQSSIPDIVPAIASIPLVAPPAEPSIQEPVVAPVSPAPTIIIEEAKPEDIKPTETVVNANNLTPATIEATLAQPLNTPAINQDYLTVPPIQLESKTPPKTPPSSVSVDRLNTDELIEKIAKDLQSASSKDFLTSKSLNEIAITNSETTKQEIAPSINEQAPSIVPPETEKAKETQEPEPAKTEPVTPTSPPPLLVAPTQVEPTPPTASTSNLPKINIGPPLSPPPVLSPQPSTPLPTSPLQTNFPINSTTSFSAFPSSYSATYPSFSASASFVASIPVSVAASISSVLPPPAEIKLKVPEPAMILQDEVKQEETSNLKSASKIINLNEDLSEQQPLTAAETSILEVVAASINNDRLNTDELIEKIAQKLETVEKNAIAQAQAAEQALKSQVKIESISFNPLSVNQDIITSVKEAPASSPAPVPSPIIAQPAIDTPLIEKQKAELTKPEIKKSDSTSKIDSIKTPIVPFKTALKFPPVLLNNISKF